MSEDLLVKRGIVVKGGFHDNTSGHVYREDGVQVYHSGGLQGWTENMQVERCIKFLFVD